MTGCSQLCTAAPSAYISLRAWLWLPLPALCLLLVICGMLSLILISWLPFWFLRDRGGGLLLLLLLRRQRQGLEVVAPRLGFGVRVVQEQMLLLFVFDHLPVDTNCTKPGPGERSRIFMTFKQIPRGHLLFCWHLKTLHQNKSKVSTWGKPNTTASYVLLCVTTWVTQSSEGPFPPQNTPSAHRWDFSLHPELPLDKSCYIFIVTFACSHAKNLKFHLSRLGGKELLQNYKFQLSSLHKFIIKKRWQKIPISTPCIFPFFPPRFATRSTPCIILPACNRTKGFQVNQALTHRILLKKQILLRELLLFSSKKT